MTTVSIETAFLKAMDALDEAWRAYRDLQRAVPTRWRADTLSDSLAYPHEQSVMAVLQCAVRCVATPEDRQGLLALAGSAHVCRLISEDALNRTIAELESP